MLAARLAAIVTVALLIACECREPLNDDVPGTHAPVNDAPVVGLVWHCVAGPWAPWAGGIAQGEDCVVFGLQRLAPGVCVGLGSALRGPGRRPSPLLLEAGDGDVRLARLGTLSLPSLPGVFEPIALACDPPRVVVADALGAICETLDNGGTWARHDFPESVGAPLCMAVDPDSRRIVVGARTGLLEWPGGTWRDLGEGVNPRVLLLGCGERDIVGTDQGALILGPGDAVAVPVPGMHAAVLWMGVASSVRDAPVYTLGVQQDNPDLAILYQCDLGAPTQGRAAHCVELRRFPARPRVRASAHGSAIAVTNNDRLYYTVDSGETWRSTVLPEIDPTDVLVSGLDVWVARYSLWRARLTHED